MRINHYTRDISIMTETGYERITQYYLNVQQIQHMLCCCRSTAYDIMSKEKRYRVHDHRAGKGGHCYQVIALRDLARVNRVKRGNPRFNDPYYQRCLALRRKTRS